MLIDKTEREVLLLSKKMVPVRVFDPSANKTSEIRCFVKGFISCFCNGRYSQSIGFPSFGRTSIVLPCTFQEIQFRRAEITSRIFLLINMRSFVTADVIMRFNSIFRLFLSHLLFVWLSLKDLPGRLSIPASRPSHVVDGCSVFK